MLNVIIAWVGFIVIVIFVLDAITEGLGSIFNAFGNRTPTQIDADVKVLMAEQHYHSNDPNVPVGSYGPRAEARQHQVGRGR